MHAVVVRVTVNDPERGTEELRSQVVPRLKQAPGFVAGYWTRAGDQGLSMTVWESEDGARRAADMISQSLPQGVELQGAEVREVVASA